MPNTKSIIILSEKSSGSSACQRLLAKFADIQCVGTSRHFENETLYWTKSASVLGKPQIQMVDSEVPIKKARAKAEIISLIQDNVPGYLPPPTDEELVFEGWRQLATNHGPIFLEKSPHHLCQWSALELIMESIQKLENIDFLLIGLIRNPLDTIYSQYSRWKSPPDKVEQQWLTAYQNLRKLKEQVGEQLVLIRYEDMVTSIDCLQPVFSFCDVTDPTAEKNFFHQKSLHKWKDDKLFGFSLSEETIKLAREYGYSTNELTNSSYPLWPVICKLSRAIHRSAVPVKKRLRQIIRKK